MNCTNSNQSCVKSQKSPVWLWLLVMSVYGHTDCHSPQYIKPRVASPEVVLSLYQIFSFSYMVTINWYPHHRRRLSNYFRREQLPVGGGGYGWCQPSDAEHAAIANLGRHNRGCRLFIRSHNLLCALYWTETRATRHLQDSNAALQMFCTINWTLPSQVE